MSDPGDEKIGENLLVARRSAKLSQTALARRSGINRTQIIKIESGSYSPRFEEVIRLAEALNCPLQTFLTGKTRPAGRLASIAFELRHFGVLDLVVSGAKVPGAFRRVEEVVVLALCGGRPEVRVIQAIPFVLARHRLATKLTLGFASIHNLRARARIAWLSDLTLVLGQRGILPLADGVEESLAQMTRVVKKPTEPDDLGHPGANHLAPVWKRWNITYGGTLAEFAARAGELTTRDRRKGDE